MLPVTGLFLHNGRASRKTFSTEGISRLTYSFHVGVEAARLAVLEQREEDSCHSSGKDVHVIVKTQSFLYSPFSAPLSVSLLWLWTLSSCLLCLRLTRNNSLVCFVLARGRLRPLVFRFLPARNSLVLPRQRTIFPRDSFSFAFRRFASQ